MRGVGWYGEISFVGGHNLGPLLTGYKLVPGAIVGLIGQAPLVSIEYRTDPLPQECGQGRLTVLALRATNGR